MKLSHIPLARTNLKYSRKCGGGGDFIGEKTHMPLLQWGDLWHRLVHCVLILSSELSLFVALILSQERTKHEIYVQFQAVLRYEHAYMPIDLPINQSVADIIPCLSPLPMYQLVNHSGCHS